MMKVEARDTATHPTLYMTAPNSPLSNAEVGKLGETPEGAFPLPRHTGEEQSLM